jgi:hypothetical protein
MGKRPREREHLADRIRETKGINRNIDDSLSHLITKFHHENFVAFEA